MKTYITPSIDTKSFTCSHCGVLAGIEWDTIYVQGGDPYYYFHKGNYNNDQYSMRVSTCRACKNPHFWINDIMVLPRESNIPMPHTDMPEKVKEIYIEAKEVFPYSPRSSAALLRLALQYLCKELGCKGENINDDIAQFVREGLSVKIQKALDAIRVIGNNAVHPGKIDLDDETDTAVMLFEILNIIVNDMITHTNQIDELYSNLPESARAAIEKRDNKNRRDK